MGKKKKTSKKSKVDVSSLSWKAFKLSSKVSGVLGAGALLGASNYLFEISMKPVKRDTSHDEEPQELPYMAGRKWMNEHPDRMDVWEKSEDGLKLHANYIPSKNENEHRFAICVHGHADSAESMGVYARVYHDRYGMNVLMPDLRGWGKSEGKYVGYGYNERKDMLVWIDWILRLDPDALIILHGISMGAATCLMTTGVILPSQVKACVSDASYTSIMKVFKHVLKLRGMELPVSEDMLLQGLRGITLARARYDPAKAAPIKAVKKSKTPTLFIHGSEDTYIPPHMMKELFEAAACRKAYLKVPGAEHVQSVNTDPEKYWGKVESFLKAVDPALIADEQDRV